MESVEKGEKHSLSSQKKRSEKIVRTREETEKKKKKKQAKGVSKIVSLLPLVRIQSLEVEFVAGNLSALKPRFRCP